MDEQAIPLDSGPSETNNSLKEEVQSSVKITTSFDDLDLRDQEIPKVDLVNGSFKNCILKRCDFSNRDLSFADFSGADLYRADFSGSTLYSTIFKNADLTRANFSGAKLYGIKLFDADITRTIFDKFIPEEKNARSQEDYSKANDIYNTVKRAFQNHGEIKNAAYYYYRQMVCSRKSNPNPLVRFLEYVFIDLLVGYGEKPIRALYASLTVIIIFGLIYIYIPALGLGAVINNQKLLIPIDNKLQKDDTLQSFKDFGSSIELSLTAFSGANVTDWQFIGAARSFLSIETFLGIILISIILIGFSRKIIRM